MPKQRVLSKILKLFTGRTYESVSLSTIWYALQKGGVNYSRGFFWAIIRFRRPRGLMLGHGIKMISSSKLAYGKGVSLGMGCYMDCSAISGVQIGNRVTIREYGWLQCRSGLNQAAKSVTIGDDVYIGPFSVLGAGGDLTISENCQIGARLTISAESHSASNSGSYVEGTTTRSGVSIGRNCWIGNNVCIIDGVHIGDNCVIGAGSVVTRNIPSNNLAFGSPARIKRATNMPAP